MCQYCYLILKGKEIAKGADTEIDPENKLLMGKTLGEFEGNKPNATEIEKALEEEGLDPTSPVENTKGTVLDNNVQSGRWVPWLSIKNN